jgi:hypothetical protein
MSCHVDYTGSGKVPGCIRKQARKNISSWAASTESGHKDSREGGARRRYRAQTMVVVSSK